MEATLIYPHQLFRSHLGLKRGRPVYLAEEPLILTHNPIHRQKLIFHKLTLDHYEHALRGAGYEVTRLSILDHRTTEAMFARLKADGVDTIHAADTSDNYLERALRGAELQRVWYESPLFLLPKAEAVSRYRTSGAHMARFYKQLRIDKQLLVGEDNTPTGGKWSFDAENRKKLPKQISLPADITLEQSKVVAGASVWAAAVPAEQYGEPGCWLPTTHDEASAFLDSFLVERFAAFGAYEDALSVRGVRLFHSTLSPLLNCGLITPQEVLDRARAHASQHAIPIASLEGFVRQVLGWREFIRAAYECNGTQMRTSNTFINQQINSLPHIERIQPENMNAHASVASAVIA